MTTLNGAQTLPLNAQGKANKAALFEQAIRDAGRENGAVERDDVINRVKRRLNFYTPSQRLKITNQDYYQAVSTRRKRLEARKAEKKSATAPTQAPVAVAPVTPPAPKLPTDLTASLDLAYQLLQSCGGNLEMVNRVLQAVTILNG